MALPGKVRTQSFTFAVSGGVATGSAPSSSTDGVPLQACKGYRVTISAATSQTLSGSGTADCYCYSETIGAWGRNPSLDIAITATGRIQSEDFESPGPEIGRIKYVPNAAAVSGGSNVTIVLDLRTAP